MPYQTEKFEVLRQYLADHNIPNPVVDTYAVATKNHKIYRDIVAAQQAKDVRFSNFMMIGDSPNSDIQPVVEYGGQAVLVLHPEEHDVKWVYELGYDAQSAVRVCHSLSDLGAMLKGQPIGKDHNNGLSCTLK